MNDEPTHEQIAQLAYKYSLNRDPQIGTPDDDWNRAEQELRKWIRLRESADKQVDFFRPFAELVAHWAKIGAGISSVPITLGAVQLVSYLHSQAAPLPPVDTSFSLFLLLFAVVFIVVFGIIVSFLLWPFVLKTLNERTVREVFHPRYRKNYLGKYLKDYGRYLLPYLLVMCVFTFCPFGFNRWAYIHSGRLNSFCCGLDY